LLFSNKFLNYKEVNMFDLKVTVHDIKGFCNLPMREGDSFILEGGKITIPEGKYFCMWALQSIMPLLPAKQRNSNDPDDWLPVTDFVSCPDPEGMVIMKIERLQNNDRI